MQKTKKSFAKRFKITGTGKVMRRSPNRRHLLSNKSVKQKRRSGQDKETSKGFSAIVHKALPHSNRT
ncbi:MAG: 50S ribosomal protein L35 [Verrucomicrobia bacterium]|nr:50S ribosomal protein L35 [Verrucomicrobiota bacterium]